MKAKLKEDVTCGMAELSAGDVIELIDRDGQLCWLNDGELYAIESDMFDPVSEAVEAAETVEAGEAIEPVAETTDAVGETEPPATETEPAVTEFDDSARSQLAAAEEACCEAEGEVDDLRERLKYAKKRYDLRVSQLRELARSIAADDDRPLLKQAGKESAASAGAATATAGGDSEAWRSASVGELGLKPKLTDRLIEAGIATLGQLVDLRAAIATGREKWPKGIGTAKVTEIENAEIEWLSKNRETWGRPAGEVLVAQHDDVIQAVVENVQQFAEETGLDVSVEAASGSQSEPAAASLASIDDL